MKKPTDPVFLKIENKILKLLIDEIPLTRKLDRICAVLNELPPIADCKIILREDKSGKFYQSVSENFTKDVKSTYSFLKSLFANDVSSEIFTTEEFSEFAPFVSGAVLQNTAKILILLLEFKNGRAFLLLCLNDDSAVRAVQNLLDEIKPALKKIPECFFEHPDNNNRLIDDKTPKIKDRQISALTDNLSGMVYRCLNDKNRTMKYVSSGIKKVTGYDPDDLIDNKTLSFGDLIHPEDRNGEFETIRKALKKREPFKSVYRVFTKDGKVKWIWEEGRGILNDEGKIEFLEGYITDITERQKYLRQTEHVNRILLTIRTINQLIVREKNEATLLTKICRLLIQSGDFKYAWIARLNQDGETEEFYQAGFFNKKTQRKNEFVKSCISKAMNSRNCLISILHPADDSAASLQAANKENTTRALVAPLQYQKRTMGVLCVGLDKTFNFSTEEEEILFELAADIAFALHIIEIEEQNKKIEQAVNFINKKVTGVTTHEVLKSLATNIARSIKADYVFITEIMNETEESIKIVACYGDGKIAENEVHALKGTPCENVINQKTRVYPEKIAELFPDDDLIKTLNAEGYIGTPLRKPDGKVIGTLVALTKSKIKNATLKRNVLEIFAHRVGVELQRFKMEEQLKESEYRYRTIFENSPFGIYRSTLDGRVIIANPALIKMLGFDSLEDLKKRDIDREGYYHKKNRLEFIKRVMSTDEFIVHESVWRKKDGSPIPVREKARAVKDSAGNLLYFEGTVEDITEQKEKEERILYQNQLLAAAQDAILATDLNFKITYWNRSAEKLYGWKAEEVLGKRIDEIVKMRMTTKERLRIRKIATEKGFWRGEVIQFNRQGEELVIDMSIGLMHDSEGKPVAIVGINRDISEKRKFEEALKASEASYRGLFNSVKEAIYIQAEDGSFLDVNEGAEKMYGYPRSYFIGKSPVDVAAPGKNDMHKVFEHFRKALQGEPQQFEFWGRRSNGEAFPKNVRLYKGQYFGQNVVIALAQDITEQKRVEERLRELTDAIEQSPVSVIITDLEGKIEYVNPKFTQVSGYEYSEVIGEKPNILKSGLMPQKVYEEIWSTISSGKVWQGELLNKRKDGTLFWEYARISAIKNEKGEIQHYLAIKEDITERKKLEEDKKLLQKQLHQNQRLETIGTLAGGIAHDFNNILTPILGYAEIIKMSVVEDPKLQDKANQIIKAALRARDLIRQVLTFSRQIDHQPKPVYLQHIVTEAYNLLRASIPSTIILEKSIDKSCPPVMADPAQMHQVLMNLCTNAYQAMEKNGGQLSITLRQIAVDEITAKHHPGLNEQTYVRLSVSDTGEGMEPWVIERIFEPFFTTKGVGKGTGLGLSVVHGIVKNCGGDIIVYSEKGKGTVFHVYLPVADVRQIEEAKEKVPIPKGGENILLVDDEPSVLELEKQMLAYFGYKVTTVLDSTKVLAKLRKNPDKYQLLITDLTMPNMTGLQLSQLIRRHFPDLPIILITGYGQQLTEDLQKNYGIRSILMKPVVAAELAKAVRKVLDN